MQLIFCALNVAAEDDCQAIPNCSNCTTDDGKIECTACDVGYFVSGKYDIHLIVLHPWCILIYPLRL